MGEKKFNEAQKTAICHKDGPMMVLAGPGSGKTTVICERVRWLIEEAGVHPASILVVTFTKAAALEMKARFLERMSSVYYPVSFGTFHSIFFSILKAAYNYQAADIVTDEQRLEMLRDIISRMHLELDDEAEFIHNILGEISLVKGENMPLDHYYSASCAEDVFRRIFTAYRQRMQAARKIDFDDMLTYTWELFKMRPDILNGWRQKFQYILIDEFQDINRIQYEVMRLLAAPRNHLFIVGDDDQSVYRFRGAKPEIMLNFMKDYPDARQILLGINYRCTQAVVEGALRVIKNNQKRYVKNLTAFNSGGLPIEIKVFDDMRQECDTVIKNIVQLHRDQHIPLTQMAVLMRTNTGARLLVAKMMEYNVPFRMKDRLPDLYEHWIAKDMIAYMKIAAGKGERSDYLRVINRPKRFIARQYLNGSQVSLARIRELHADKSWALEHLDKLIYDLKSLAAMSPFAAINYIRYAMGYDAWLTDYASERRMKSDDLFEVAAELMESARSYDSLQDWCAYMEDYKRKLSALAAKRDAGDKDCVTVSTMHSAKGLEYEAVFIIDANEGVSPYKRAVMSEDIEEERRLFYVAMTRAKKYLYIYFTKERYHKPAAMSRFVGELLLDREQFVPGKTVRHKVYGSGRIVNVSETAVSILFSETGAIKTLSLSYCIANQMLTF